MQTNTGSLVDLAKEILRNAETLQAELGKAGAPQPSTAVNGPLQYPRASEHPAVYKAREGLINASEAMVELSRGPAETMRARIQPERMFMPILRVITHFDIHSIVPQDGSMPIKDLAANLNVHPGLLERILRLSFLHGLFHEPSPGYIAHNALSQTINLLEGYIWIQSRADFSSALYAWPKALKNYGQPGKRQVPLYIARDSDVPIFDIFSQEDGGMEHFAKGMRDHSQVTGSDQALVTAGFDWETLGSGPVVDLGGGAGHAAVVIAQAHPQLHLVVQDLAINEGPARETIPDSLKGRVTFQVQDFFQPQADQTLHPKAFFLKGVLHDWSDDDCVRILTPLLPHVEQRGAKIVICERIPPSPGDPYTTLDANKVFMDLLMWTLFDAKERARPDWEALLRRVDPRFKVEMRSVLGNEFGIVVASF